ncbi:IgGFc-binding protein-like [Dendronephthya gigantea]|uniref:IgGFc-binding protein-like n=1 Tax=Dendronephthya gigantea TaxID=151771 RepID=UPI00106C1679|nr:IgGFc-binding protein-like [Dendronephthya gigantea]
MEPEGNLSNYGTHFIVGFMPNSRHDAYIGVSILAFNETNITIFSTQTGNPWNFSVHIDKEGVFEYKLPIALRMNNWAFLQKGIEISSSRNISVSCLNFGGNNNFGTDGKLALPINTLCFVYVVASYPSCTSASLAVISAHNNNTINVFPNKNAVLHYRGLLYDGKSSQLYITEVLEKLDALYISSSSDLSGTLVIASKPVSVISSVSCADIFGWNSFLEATLLPVSLWGYEYILATVGTMDKSQGDIFRIFAYKNNTIVEGSHWTKVLSLGTYTELILGNSLTSYVKCSNPCQVVQYIRGEEISGIDAEPSIMVLPSVGQFLSYYHVALPRFGTEYHDSITILIQHKNIDGLYMNRTKLNNSRWERINGTNYVWTVISLWDQSTVTVYHASSSVKFGLLVFGWNKYHSYAYAGGFNLYDKSNGMISLLV